MIPVLLFLFFLANEISDHPFPFDGEDRFRVKLNSFRLELPMSQAHYFPFLGPRAHFQALRERHPLHDQRMVSDGFERVGHPPIYGSAIVKDERSLAMHDPVGP